MQSVYLQMFNVVWSDFFSDTYRLPSTGKTGWTRHPHREEHFTKTHYGTLRKGGEFIFDKVLPCIIFK